MLAAANGSGIPNDGFVETIALICPSGHQGERNEQCVAHVCRVVATLRNQTEKEGSST